ncbi:hypothetical protein QZH41_013802, partial [Actinostola sp. cb2023]
PKKYPAESMAAVTNTLILSVCGVLILGGTLALADGECIQGKYHKDKPSAATGFQICQEYSNNTCCTKSFTDTLKRSRTEELYNHTWDLCKALSKPCEQYWLQQECFYQCSPYVYKWQHPSDGQSIHGGHTFALRAVRRIVQFSSEIPVLLFVGVPICSSVCDGWFDACKDDQICVQDVLTGYEFLANGTNRCPANSSCTTYSDMFKNGEGLCNKMWNTSYVYTTENAEHSNCMLLSFNGTNPNGKVMKPTAPPPTKGGPSGEAFTFKGSVIVTMLALMMNSLIAVNQ